MATVFLSYARQDRPRVRPVAAALEKAGHKVWWDEQVAGGDQFTRAIQQALEQADAVVVAWSEASVESPWVRDEAAYGRDRGRLVPVTLDGCQPPLGFREYQAIDLSAGGRTRARAIEALKHAIDAKAGDPAVASLTADSRPRARRKWWVPKLAIAAIAGVILIAAALLVAGVIPNPLAERRQVTPSIAVLPFADLSPGRDKAYFAEGVAEEILGTLAAEQGIKVLGRTSTRLIERGADPKDLRRKLGLTHLLEGSARSGGDQLRVNVRLIDTADGRQVWEEEYQGGGADIFAVQDRIAGAVAQRLRGTLAQRTARPTTPTDPETFQTYLAARALMRNRSQKGLQEAFTLAQQVIRRDPKYAPGHAIIAELYQMLSDDFRAYGTMPLAQARRLGIQHAKRAIQLAPDIPDGYAGLGIHLEREEALPPLRRAIQLDPSRGELRTWLGFALNDLGRHDEALVEYHAAVEIDPLGFTTINRLVHALAAAGEPKRAESTIRQFVERGGDPLLEPTLMMQVAQPQGNRKAVIAHGRRMLANERVRHQYFRLFLASALHTLGQGREAAAALLPMQDLHAAYYRGDQDRLRSLIRARGAKIWGSVDAGFAFTHLARLRDWPALAGLHEQRTLTFAEFCGERPNDAIPLVLGLRAAGKTEDAAQVLDCLRRRLSVELRNKARLPQDFAGALEFRRASYGALTGDRQGTLAWLERAVSRGWLGEPYSSRLADYPQFDLVRSDPRYLALQRRIDRNVAAERAGLGSPSPSR